MRLNEKIKGLKLPMNGWIALSPLFVFLVLYLVSSIVARDFYKIPISAAFLLSSIYAVIITPGKSIENKIEVFSKGAGDKNVLLMIWIFVLTGVFAATAKEIGAIDATVNVALHILPGRFLYAGLFLSACFISMAVGTSVGTIVALVPVAAGIATEAGLSLPFITAIIVGGAFFGDNLSFISDTTIAATKTQHCSMADKFKANLRIAVPAALIVTVIYIVLGAGVYVTPKTGPVAPMKLLPYILVIVLALSRMNVTVILTLGILCNAVIGFSLGELGWTSFLVSAGWGIGSMGDLIIVTMLAGGMLETIRENGGLDFMVQRLTKHISGRRGAEFSIAALVSLANICTANNTIAIITTGGIAHDISKRFGLKPRRTASLLDTFSCTIQGILPYGAQLLMAAGLAGISTFSIIGHLFYPFLLGFCAVLAILVKK